MPPSEQRSHRLQQALLGLLILLAIVSTVVGAVNAVHRSQDFQWSGASVLDQHIDPWAEYLRGDPNHLFILVQVPNYLAILYVLIAPLGLLPLFAAKSVWMVCNIVFAIASGIIAGRFYGMGRRGIVATVCLLLMATATRNTIGNGQTGLLVLLLWCLGLLSLRMSATRAAIAGVSYFKFSFAPPLFLFLLLRRGVRAAAVSLVPAVAAIVLVWLWLGHDPHTLIRIALEPFAVARTGFSLSLNDPNLMNEMEPALHHLPFNTAQTVELAVASVVCVVISWMAFVVHRGSSVRWQVALMATMSYALFKHHPYDAVVLLFPLCYALRRSRETQAKIMLALVAYLFYLLRLLEALHLHPSSAHPVEFITLLGILVLTYRLREGEDADADAALRSVPARAS